jgi:hypothetical protein
MSAWFLATYTASFASLLATVRLGRLYSICSTSIDFYRCKIIMGSNIQIGACEVDLVVIGGILAQSLGFVFRQEANMIKVVQRDCSQHFSPIDLGYPSA